MSKPEYRSYLVRIRRRAACNAASLAASAEPTETHATVRAEVEDLLGGTRARIDGDGARLLADDLEALVRPGEAARDGMAGGDPAGRSDVNPSESGTSA